MKVGDRVRNSDGREGTITAVQPQFDTRGDSRSQFLDWNEGCLVRFDGDEGEQWNYMDAFTVIDSSVRSFPSGATRDTDQGKLDFEGFLSPLALEAFAKYMQKHQIRSDGTLRAADDWQKGIPIEVYMKSMFRHFFSVWRGHRGEGISTDDLCGVLFNIQGLLHETLKAAKP